MNPTRRRRATWAPVAAALIGWGATLGVALPVSISRVQAQNAENSPARLVPGEQLVYYLEWVGLDARRDDWNRTAAAQVLNEAGYGRILNQIVEQIASYAERSMGPNGPDLDFVRAVVTRVVDRGFALGVQANFAEPVQGNPLRAAVAVFTGVGRNDLRPTLEVLLGQFGFNTVQAEDVTYWILLPPPVFETAAIWFVGEDLVIAAGQDNVAQLVNDVAQGRSPSALKNPIRERLVNPTDAQAIRALGLGFIELEGVPFGAASQALGLDGLKRVESVIGFQGAALATEARIVAPAPRRGLLTLLDQPGLDWDNPPPIPAEVNDFTIVSFDPAAAIKLAKTLTGEFDPRAPAQIDQTLADIKTRFQIDLEGDWIKAIGHQFSFFVVPPSENDNLNMLYFRVPKVAMVAQPRDPAQFRAGLDRTMNAVNPLLANAGMPMFDAAFEEMGMRFEFPEGPPASGQLQFRKLKTGDGWALTIPPAVFPMNVGVRPTALVGPRDFVLSVSPEAARQVTAIRAGEQPSWFEQKSNRQLIQDLKTGGKPILFAITDPRDTTPQFLMNVPAMVQGLAGFTAYLNPDAPPFVLEIDPDDIPSRASLRKPLFPNTVLASVDDSGLTIRTRTSLPAANVGVSTGAFATALMLPAVQSAREAARRTQCANNLKQMAIAAFNYEVVYGRFPDDIRDPKTGEPLLSWRVAILPYLEQQNLYNRFKLDEPWDSPHNLELLNEMPAIFRCPSDDTMGEGMTGYLSFRGPGAFLDRPGGTRINEITDGTSNTIMVAESLEGIEWTRPRDFTFDPEAEMPVEGIGSKHPGGYNALIGDGSVAFLRTTLDPQTLKALITRNGGEIISADRINPSRNDLCL